MILTVDIRTEEGFETSRIVLAEGDQVVVGDAEGLLVRISTGPVVDASDLRDVQHVTSRIRLGRLSGSTS